MKKYLLVGILISGLLLLAFPSASAAEQKTLTGKWEFYAVHYKVEIKWNDPYDDYITVNLVRAYVNQSRVGGPSLIREMAWMKSIIISYKYGSIYYSLNQTLFYNYTNGDLHSWEIYKKLYFPIKESGTFVVNITLEYTYFAVFFIIPFSSTVDRMYSIQVNSNKLDWQTIAIGGEGAGLIALIVLFLLFRKK